MIDMNSMDHVVINKNRGWRGLAEVKVRTKDYKDITTMIFSFSQVVWTDLIEACTMVIQDEKYYYVLKFNTDDCDAKLPKPTQQRSVLIKNAELKIREVNKVEKTRWTTESAFNWSKIMHFLNNTNNHTTSDWNCIGVRVVPEI